MTKTRGTSGQKYSEPFASFDHNSSSWKTSGDTSGSDSTKSSLTLPPSGSMRNGRLFEQATLEPHISVPDSSSQPGQQNLATPTSSVAVGGPPQDSKGKRDLRLDAKYLAGLLPTPSHADGTGGPGVSDKRAGGMNLRTAVTLLPTPAASVPQDGEAFETWDARRQIAKAKHGNNGIGMPLTIAVQTLPTPTSRDWKGGVAPVGRTRPDGRIRTEGDQALPDAVVLMATPRASDGEKGGPNQCNSRGEFDALPSQVHVDRFGKYAAAVERWEAITGSVAPDPTLPDGRNGNHRLNPAFAAWMMEPQLVGKITNPSTGLSRKQQLKMVGNMVVPRQARHAVLGLVRRAAARSVDTALGAA